MDFKNMSLREKVYRTLIIRDFQMGTSGTMEEFFEKYPVGGFYYHKGPAEGLIEMKDGEATPRQDFIVKCRKTAKYPLVVCADGANIGDNGLDALTAIIVGGANSEELAYEYGKSVGMQMNANDVDWLLGPCVDMAYCRALSSSSGQPMTDDPEFASRIFSQIVKGLQDQNVAATVKHFPGVGTHHINFHISHGHNVFPFDKWMETYGKVYSDVFKAGSMSVMTSHLTLKSFSDKADYGNIPMSRLDDAVERIERFYKRLGIDENGRKAPEFDAEYVDDTFKKIVKKSATLVRNERGILPISKDKKNMLINVISPAGLKRWWYEPAVESANHFADIMNKNGFETEIRYNFIEFWEDKLFPDMEKFDYIITLVSAPLQVDIFPDCFNSVWTTHLIDKSKKILVNFATPFFLDDYFSHEQTIIQLYGGISKLNVEAAADAILGNMEMEGKLPYKLNL